MIWDDIREQAPCFRRPEVQVIRVPFEILSQRGETIELQKTWYGMRSLFPRRPSGEPDASWIQPPFEEFAVINGESHCVFVTCFSKAESVRGVSAWRDACEWFIQADLISRLESGRFGFTACAMVGVDSNGGLVVPESFEEDHILEGQHQATSFRSIETGGDICASTSRDSDLAGTYVDLCKIVAFSALIPMALMSCKNIGKTVRTASRQLRRQADRSGLPLVSWHELTVAPSSTVKASANGEGESIALHWVRGHFKDYREKGLFGSQKGVYWWSPHLAGQADRVVLKDYRVEA